MAAKKAAAYTRVSTTRQATEGLSLGEQDKRVRAYIKDKGWKLLDVFTDAGISGRKDDRPELTKMLARLGEIDVIVVPALSRLGRSNRHLQDIFGRLEAADVELVSLSENIDTSTPTGNLLRNVLASLSQFEADLIGERVASSARARAVSGRPHGRASYGYRTKGGHLVPVERERVIVARIFSEAASGRSQRAIARKLNEDSVPSQRNMKWTQASVASILKNPTYKGVVRFGDEEFQGKHETIIDAALWDKLAAERERAVVARKGKGKTGPRPGPGRLPVGPHLFTQGLLVCGYCGSAMSPRTDKRSGREDYRCLGRERAGNHTCPQLPIPRKDVDPAVFDYFRRVAVDAEQTRQNMLSAIEAGRREVEERLAEAVEREAKIAADLESIRADYKARAITAAEWHSLRDELEADHAAAQSHLTAMRDHRAELPAEGDSLAESEVFERLRDIQRAIAGEITNAEGIDAVRQAMRRAFDRFVVIRADTAPDLPALSPREAERVAEVKRTLLSDLRRAGADPFTTGAKGWLIVPWPKPEAIQGADETFRPILKREALTPANKESSGVTMTLA